MLLDNLSNWRIWWRGLAAASISGGAQVVANIAADPYTFNFDDGIVALGKAAFVSAVIGALLYLKKSPIPEAQLNQAIAKAEKVERSEI